MRIAIVGSRNINNYELVNSKIKDFIQQLMQNDED